MTDRLKIGLTWQLNTYTGWGVFGMQCALALASRPDVELSFWSADLQGLNALDLHRLYPIAARWQTEVTLGRHRQQPIPFDGILIHADGNHFGHDITRQLVQAERNMGLMVFEDTAFTPEEIARGQRYDWLVTGSRWNQDVLRTYGLESTCVMQGIDPTVFHPAPRSGRWADRFVIFSGGKLEYRKGQDIVLAAFREFHARHPEALLVTAWQNKWPQLAVDMTLNGHIEKEPLATSDGVDIEGWFTDNGIPEGAALDLGIVPNVMLGPIVREADVAVFMSRAEGGTNLMAMECMAAGVRTLVSGGSGHLDLVAEHVEPRFQPHATQRHFQGMDGWAEVHPEDLADALELQRESWWRQHHEDWLGIGPLRTSYHPPPPTWQQYADTLVSIIRGEYGRAAA